MDKSKAPSAAANVFQIRQLEADERKGAKDWEIGTKAKLESFLTKFSGSGVTFFQSLYPDLKELANTFDGTTAVDCHFVMETGDHQGHKIQKDVKTMKAASEWFEARLRE
ncbi:MAG: hypothetical protein MMC23_005110 [Stictis urceolatum]|nr:hypothetical protein [Stictis urceolata]